MGRRFRLSHSATGGLLAAIGTALPETLVPIIALLSGKTGQKEDIAIGAILGAPFMLATLAMFFLGLTTLARKKVLKRPVRAALEPDAEALKAETNYILAAMLLVFIASLAGNRLIDVISAILLLGGYVLFFRRTLRRKGNERGELDHEFYFGQYLAFPKRIRWYFLQVTAGLFLMSAGAGLFVKYIEALAAKSGVSPLVLSLLIVPFATEMPEKFNSVLWTLKGKDTLALANVTGAMVFQSSIPVSIGLLFTKWTLGTRELSSIVIVILMALMLRVTISVSDRKEIPFWLLLFGGAFYLLYFLQVISILSF